MTEQISAPATTAPDPGVVCLFGVLAYGELMAFFDVARVAELAPTVADRQTMGELATHEYGNYEKLAGRLRDLGVEPKSAMEPFQEAFDTWHARITPADWLEGLMKIYAGSTVATDFYRECAKVVDPQTGALISDALENSGQVDFARQKLRAAIAADARLAGRLALLGRRLMGETLSQAQLVAVEHDDLLDLLMDDGSGNGFDLAGFRDLLKRLGDQHTQRMADLGLDA